MMMSRPLTELQAESLRSTAEEAVKDALAPALDVMIDWVHRDRTYLVVSSWMPMNDVDKVKSMVDIYVPTSGPDEKFEEMCKSVGKHMVGEYRGWYKNLNRDAEAWRQRQAKIENRWWKRFWRHPKRCMVGLHAWPNGVDGTVWCGRCGKVEDR